jgi:Mg-chelatase subunit ChlD
MNQLTEERLRRWRLILGGGEADGICQDNGDGDDGVNFSLSSIDEAMDDALSALYDSEKSGGLSDSSPKIARWLGDIRSYFPTSVVQVMQKNALERLNLQQMLLEPELLAAVEPDVHLVANLLSLTSIMPSETKETARMVVHRVVEKLQEKFTNSTRQAIMGSLNRAVHNRRPRHNEIDWDRTIRANLKHYQPEYKTIIPETRIGYTRKRSCLKDIILCIDQSGSMATSVVYAGVFGAVLASLTALKTSIVVFDTSVLDLTDLAQDPVDLLFGTQLGGGTDINQALTYCQKLLRKPQETILILISDLYEGGNREEMLKRVAQLVGLGVKFITLLSLSDEGTPVYDSGMGEKLAKLGIPALACTPDLFPELMGALISGKDIIQWQLIANQ